MAKKRSSPPTKPKNILAIDIGGTNLKILVTGEHEPRRAPSGSDLTPGDMVERVRKLANGWKYDLVSIGYPGLVGGSGPAAEPGNLGPGWVGFDFAAAFERPVRIANDAAMQALGSYDGGRMLFLGLGTGLGSTLIANEQIVELELGQIRYSRRRDLAYVLNDAGLQKFGRVTWEKRVKDVVEMLSRAFLTDYVVIGGGNARKLKTLPEGARRGDNRHAFLGGEYLWMPRKSQEKIESC